MPGKGKSKKFIDKKNSVTFYLAHRSQKDPLIVDETAPQRVLVPLAEAGGARAEAPGTSKGSDKELTSKESRKTKQLEYGIYFDDDYDYLQHLKNSEEVSNIEWDIRERLYAPKVETVKDIKEAELPSTSKKNVTLNLPSSVFQSEFEEKVGLLNKAVESRGFRPDLDPDVLAALDDDFDFENPENELEDNFMELAQGEAGPGEKKTLGGHEDMEGLFDSDDEEDDMDEGDDKLGELYGGRSDSEDGEHNTRFTNYSMSSSVLRRNEQLTLLDDRFEKMFEDYDDTEIGALDCDEIEGHLDPQSQMLLKYAEQHEREAEKEENLKNKIEKLVLKQDEEEESETDDHVWDDKEEPKEKWDCESILSTYSTTKNRPKLIKEPSKRNPITLSGKNQLPKDTLGLGLTKEKLKELDAEYEAAHGSTEPNAKSMISSLSAMRTKDETPEERARRKKLLREYRHERRIEKKANADAFKDEKKRQEKVRLNNVANVQGLKI